MPWNNNGGQNSGGNPWGNPRPGGPWGQPPQDNRGGNGGGRGPGNGGGGPDLDDAIRQAQAALRRILPGGGGGGQFGASNRKWILGGVAVLLIAWGASGIYRVQPDEQGVVMRFGAFNRTTQPGLNYRIPWPVESVTTPRVTRINRVDVGFRGANDSPLSRPVSARDVLEESMMLTGDENIIDIDFAVFWRIRDAGEYLFNTRNPDQTVKSAAESVMREVVGRTPIQPALTEARAQIEQSVRTGTQAILDQYGSGVEITQVQLLKVDPPPAVIDAFRDVQRANADRERARNEAEAYRNDIIPRARGEGQRLVQEAEGFKESQVARARGEAARFLSVLTAYQTAKDVTVRRLYLETMEEILRRNPKIVVDDRLQGVVPYLPLDGAAQGAGNTPRAARPAPPGLIDRSRPATPPAAGAAPAPQAPAQGAAR
ncbi:FtsH protease activity modulator HflK [Roseomonas haemaphysalidis]|uniref:Protein HflK n=1 Tax=Roseomonas haemaphysalidis TaxID=2768162 RepID=A0ABS3KV74_9PROT|nr:FtsH protease activity modulator HflK [Roseomonas haemaphysalidis]MBO1080840.1 FtsH protease activity modulator HflK [Roseomonas haemaphysalidis]